MHSLPRKSYRSHADGVCVSQARVISFFVDPKLAGDPPPMFVAARFVDACLLLVMGLFWLGLNTCVCRHRATRAFIECMLIACCDDCVLGLDTRVASAHSSQGARCTAHH